ncbi:MAG: hypothetical protein J2P43_14810, partial [Candidatus Dormibacteraeota bacterium]|nr:hypothetical protein [Candidatus Dormibacteraeota bacterium]
VTLHGRVEPTTGGQSRLATAIERRYGVRPAGGTLLRLQPDRVTSWRGFDVSTRPYPRPEAQAAGAPRAQATPGEDG